jgi:biotin carboxyl carrier protein
MKYTAIIKNKQYEVEIGANNTVLVNGEPHRVDFQSIDGTAIYSLLLDTASWEALVERTGDEYRVVIEGAQHVVEVQDERTRKLTKVTKFQGGAGVDTPMKAPMPGLVREVRVNVGDPVRDRQGIVILEAMKMENELRVPRAGVVKEIRVKPGDKVDQGQVLLVIK